MELWNAIVELNKMTEGILLLLFIFFCYCEGWIIIRIIREEVMNNNNAVTKKIKSVSWQFPTFSLGNAAGWAVVFFCCLVVGSCMESLANH